MSKFLSIAMAGALVVGSAFVALTPNPASAQQSQKTPVILILNQSQVLAQSKAGQSMAPQLESLQEQANKDLNAEVEKIVKESEDLQKQKGLMAEDVWTQKAQQLAVKQNNLPVLREVKVRELSIAEQQAINNINEVMLPILKEIVENRGATVLLERSAVMYASTDTDITQQVISELDKKLKTVKVEKVSLAELQRQAQEAQKNQQSGKKK
ncbi:MAG: OmpH family outer membrane protein [Parvularculaceae bacterium]|nr:OmpH family outer membrane protein [Parvularculaceae bacterium]